MHLDLSEFMLAMRKADIAELEHKAAVKIFNSFEKGDIDLGSFIIAMNEARINGLARNTIEQVLRGMMK